MSTITPDIMMYVSIVKPFASLFKTWKKDNIGDIPSGTNSPARANAALRRNLDAHLVSLYRPRMLCLSPRHVGFRLLVIPLLFCLPVPSEGALPPQKPNIIFILADDLGYGELGCYGQEKIKTPNLDQLAREGMRFTQCYAGTAVCAPSRCSLMTGLHTGHTRIRGNEAFPLQPEDLTVAELLKQAGYKTMAVGKWGMGLANTSGTPNKKGFDEWFGCLSQNAAHDYYPTQLYRNERIFTLEKNLNGARGQYSSRRDFEGEPTADLLLRLRPMLSGRSRRRRCRHARDDSRSPIRQS
jgi:hypothetical protein